MPPSEPATRWRVLPRRKEPDDEFFHEGNLFCHLASSSKLLSTAERSEIFRSDEDAKTFSCQVAFCHETFVDLSSYESHYHSRHRNVCSSCRKVWPTNYLLDIHISEEHDPVFALGSHNRMYRCLVESCPETFEGANQRKDHLICIHKYPSSFRFGRESSNETLHVQLAGQPAQSAANDVRLSADAEKAAAMEREGVAAGNRAAQGRTFAFDGRVPPSISFGRGVLRGFKSGGRGSGSRGRGRAAKQGYRDTSHPATEAKPTLVNLASPAYLADVDRGSIGSPDSPGPSPEVDMSDLAAALPLPME